MTTAYPEAFDNFNNPLSGDTQNSVTVPHSLQHTNINDAVEAIEQELGVNPSGAGDTVVARFTTIEAAIAAVAVTAASALADGTVTAAKLATNAVTGIKILDNTITDTKLTTDSVTTGKIAALAVTAAKIAANTITSDKLALTVMTTAKVTSVTRPAHSAGTYIYETDTFRTLMSDGTGWVIMNEPAQAFNAFTISGVTVGSPVKVGSYHRSDGYCDFEYTFTLGAGSGVTGEIILTLPVAGILEMGNIVGTFIDPGVNYYPGVIIWSSTSTITLRATNASGTYASSTVASSIIPFTWASGDIISLRGRYRMSTRYL